MIKCKMKHRYGYLGFEQNIHTVFYLSPNPLPPTHPPTDPFPTISYKLKLNDRDQI